MRNDPTHVAACIEALLTQTYPADRVQIVIVDNDSDDDTRQVVGRYPVELVVERTSHGPYAARNAGIRVATGEVIAFTDASCVPSEGWLTNGVHALLESGADLVGGKVTFTFSARPTVGEGVDALINVDVEASIANHRACMTGNLFVRRAVLAEIGAFDASRRSGGDMRWTRRASDAGFRLVYAAHAEVSYPARPLGPLLRKQYRVGRGAPGVWQALGMSRSQMVAAIVRGTLPMPPGRLAARARDRLAGATPDRLVRLWLGVWLCKVVRAAGCIDGMVRQPGAVTRCAP